MFPGDPRSRELQYEQTLLPAMTATRQASQRTATGGGKITLPTPCFAGSILYCTSATALTFRVWSWTETDYRVVGAAQDAAAGAATGPHAAAAGAGLVQVSTGT